MIAGLTRWAITRSRIWLTTSEVICQPTSIARHSRVSVSIRVNIRILRPSDNASATKSMLQRSLGRVDAGGTGCRAQSRTRGTTAMGGTRSAGSLPLTSPLFPSRERLRQMEQLDEPLDLLRREHAGEVRLRRSQDLLVLRERGVGLDPSCGGLLVERDGPLEVRLEDRLRRGARRRLESELVEGRVDVSPDRVGRRHALAVRAVPRRVQGGVAAAEG